MSVTVTSDTVEVTSQYLYNTAQENKTAAPKLSLFLLAKKVNKAVKQQLCYNLSSSRVRRVSYPKFQRIIT